MPRLGVGMPVTASSTQAVPVVIDDYLWEDIDSNNSISVNYQETRTNSVLYSQDATNAEAWSKTNVAADNTLYEAPDGSNTANAIKSDSTGEKAYNITQGSLSVTAGKTYTLSVHFKKQNLDFARIYFSDGASKTADFNLNTGAVGTTSNTLRTQVDAMDDGWYRCSMTFVATSTVSSGQARFYAQSASGDNTPNVAVSGVVLLYVWGFQLEENSEPSAYIVTTTEARTATTSLSDSSRVWDFDSADLMPEADPDSEGAWETLDNLVLNGNYEELGSDLVTNGTFDADSNWTKYTGWSIGDGKASCDGSQSGNSELVQQNGIKGVTLNIVNGKTYELTLDVVVQAGAISQVEVGSSYATDDMTSTGTYTRTITASSTNKRLTITANSSFVGSVDNVILKQVDPNDRWSLTGGTSISDGKMTVTGASGTSLGFQSMLVQGTAYELTYTISNFSSSSGNTDVINNDGATIQSISGNGTFTVIFTHSIADGNLIFRATSGTNSYQVDNVTVREYAIQPQDV